MLNSDPTPDIDALLGAGLVGILIGIVVYLGVLARSLALSLWIGYLIMKATVFNGLREHTMRLESRRGQLR